MRIGEMSTDYWLENGLTQPKFEVGQYVESMGVPVPPRYDTLADALEIVKHGASIIMRSEHPGDYTGASGLASSLMINKNVMTWGRKTQQEFEMYNVDEELIRKASRNGMSVPKEYGGPGYGQVEDMILANVMNSDPDMTIEQLLLLQSLTTQLQRYALLSNQPVGQFLDQASYSFWKQIEGTNITIMADDVIDGQYHAFAVDRTEGKTQYDGVVLKGNQAIKASWGVPGQFTPQFSSKVVEMYEKVRNLPRFSSNHCPIIEMQVDDNGEVWFLQYHRSRDFDSSKDRLDISDYPSEDGWIKAEMVRGSVGRLATLETALWYPEGYSLPDTEDASADFHYDMALTDLMSPRRQAFISNDDWGHLYSCIAVSHEQRVKWLKPQTAFTLGRNGFTSDLVGEGLLKMTTNIIHKEKKMARIVLDIATDGVDGFARLNPNIEQPQLTDY